MVILVHIALSIVLFFSINLLGQYSPSSFKYYQLSNFLEIDEAPAFNFIIRVLSPIVYIILVSTLLYAFSLDKFVINIYLVSVYYVLFRFSFNILINRTMLINWKKHVFYSIAIISLSYFVYAKIIKVKANLLPDFSNIANELWIIIIIFLYNFINNVKFSEQGAERRKYNYLNSRFNSIIKKYGAVINQETGNLRLRQIAIAIIIYEEFNRPALFRIIENISFFLTRKKHSLGIMQVQTDRLISNMESVKLGVQKLTADFGILKSEFILDSSQNKEWLDEAYQEKLIQKYNPDIIYSSEVMNLVNDINIRYYNSVDRTLFI